MSLPDVTELPERPLYLNLESHWVSSWIYLFPEKESRLNGWISYRSIFSWNCLENMLCKFITNSGLTSFKHSTEYVNTWYSDKQTKSRGIFELRCRENYGQFGKLVSTIWVIQFPIKDGSRYSDSKRSLLQMKWQKRRNLYPICTTTTNRWILCLIH